MQKRKLSLLISLFVLTTLACGLTNNLQNFMNEDFDNEDYNNENYDNEENYGDEEYNNEEYNDEPDNEEENNPNENSGENNAPSSGSGDGSVGETNLSIQSLPSSLPSGLDQVFSKYVSVFGVPIVATKTVSDAKVLQAAGVMAQYLDNDEDGQPDDPAVVASMNSRGALLFMYKDPNEMERNDFMEICNCEDDIWAQPLFGYETVPGGNRGGEFDFAIEEVLHLIYDNGYVPVYPDQFGYSPGTELTNAMDAARGGRFMDIPSSYPSGAWYSYDDPTCEYDCMASEYFYWALTSILGAQEGRLDEIGHEWKLNTADKVRLTDTAVYELLTNPAYNLPTRLPDGNYMGN